MCLDGPCIASVDFMLHQMCQAHLLFIQGENVFKFPQQLPQLLLLPWFKVITAAFPYLPYCRQSVNPACCGLLVEGRGLHNSWGVGCVG